MQYTDDAFEYDENKSDENIRNHGFNFEEAKLIWLRPNEIVYEDDDGDYNEDRFIAWGRLPSSTIVMVVYTYRADKIRIISAREAKPHERKRYFETLHRPKW